MGFGMITKRKAVLLAIMLVALGLRMYMLAEKEFGVDEKFQEGLVTGSLENIVTTYKKEIIHNPPLHTILSHCIYVLFGRYYFVKLFSVFCGLAAIILIYKITETTTNKKAAITAAILLAFNPLHIFYSQHTRSYSMLIFLYLVLIYTTLRFLQKQTLKNGIVVSIIGGIIVYTHYVGLLAVVASFLLILFKEKRITKIVLISMVLSIIIFLPLVLVMLTHPSPWSSPFEKSACQGSFNFIFNTIYIFYKFANGITLTLVSKTSYLLLVSGIVVNLAFVSGTWKIFEKKEEWPKNISIFFFWLPLIGVVLISLSVRCLMHFRYSVFLLPIYLYAVSVSIAHIKNPILRVLILALIIISWCPVLYIYYTIVSITGWCQYVGL